MLAWAGNPSAVKADPAPEPDVDDALVGEARCLLPMLGAAERTQAEGMLARASSDDQLRQLVAWCESKLEPADA